jgi:hypothetical protein
MEAAPLDGLAADVALCSKKAKKINTSKRQNDKHGKILM